MSNETFVNVLKWVTTLMLVCCGGLVATGLVVGIVTTAHHGC